MDMSVSLDEGLAHFVEGQIASGRYLFVESTKLRGVGPKVAAALDRLLGSATRPARVLDRSTRAKLRDAPSDRIFTLRDRRRIDLDRPKGPRLDLDQADWTS